ncbi:MAG: hypothetical protein NTW21_41855 [Verrucomicrobia bacterium]|nr:hypothetical protein [Verrucomicrobiota bacterium]
MERSGSPNATVITPIPFGQPVAQTGTGCLPGRIAITANAKAINHTLPELDLELTRHWP